MPKIIAQKQILKIKSLGYLNFLASLSNKIRPIMMPINIKTEYQRTSIPNIVNMTGFNFITHFFFYCIKL